jgi:hypothetical protein
MSEAKADFVGAIHYRTLAAVGLGMLCLGQYWQEVVDVPNILLAAVGVWMILFPRPFIPPAFLVLVSIVQIFAHFYLNHGFRFTPAFLLFEPTTLLLAAGMTIFLGSQFRLLALQWHIAPYDPRFSQSAARDQSGRPVAPLTRPEAALATDEIIRFVVLTALWTFLGQWGWYWLNDNWSVVGFSPRFIQVAFLIWIGAIGLFIGAGVVGYWRRAHSDPELARLYLQEVAWSDARRDYGRMGRWIAWGKRVTIASARKRAKPPDA